MHRFSGHADSGALRCARLTHAVAYAPSLACSASSHRYITFPTARPRDGDPSINAYVKSVLWTRLLEAYNISLNVVSLAAGTNTGVDRIAVAAATGQPTPIDMIWINGNNYKNMSQMGMLYGARPPALCSAPGRDSCEDCGNLAGGLWH